MHLSPRLRSRRSHSSISRTTFAWITDSMTAKLRSLFMITINIRERGRRIGEPGISRGDAFPDERDAMQLVARSHHGRSSRLIAASGRDQRLHAET
jgi:hypothetical protein